MNDHDMPHGIYPMLYAFFNAQGGLDRQATRRQVQAFVDNGAHGMAVLGLGTEVNKLSDIERRQLVDWVADRVELPVAIQSAPEYLGVGLTPAGVKTLARNHPNFRILKAEGAALAIRQVIEEVGDGVTVFNGRGGLELTDNLRAGCAGMIPASDTFDRQARIFHFLREGAETHAEALYREVLPAIVFVMQSLDTLHTYGKRIAAMRMGLGEGFDRAPALQPNAFGMRCAQRYAAALGPLA